MKNKQMDKNELLNIVDDMQEAMGSDELLLAKVSDEDLDLIVKVMSNPEVLQNRDTFNKFYEASTKSIRVADLAYIVPNVIDRRLLSIMNEQAIVEEILHKKFKVTKEEFKKYIQDYQERLKIEVGQFEILVGLLEKHKLVTQEEINNIRKAHHDMIKAANEELLNTEKGGK